MRIWFDTEFLEDGKTIDLISIGAVRDDHRTYYAEVAGFDLSGLPEWHQKNVVPHLVGAAAQRSPVQIANELLDFCGAKPELWAYYADYDWVVLCQLFGTMMDLPEHWPMFCMDVKQLAVMKGNPKLPPQIGKEHHALADALWNRDAWSFLMDIPS